MSALNPAVRAVLLILLGAAILPTAAPLWAQSVPSVLDDGWRTASPMEAGLDSEVLLAMTEAIRRGEHGNVHALLIEKDGRLVYEEYFTGEDESLGQDLGRVRFGRTSLHRS